MGINDYVKAAVLSSVLLTTSAHAAVESIIDRSVNWLKSNVPETTVIHFDKERYSALGCKHREYVLVISQPLNAHLSLEAGITHKKGQIDWGTYSQALRTLQYTLMPRLNLSGDASIGAGVIKQSAPNFRTNQGVDVNLPGHTRFVIDTRFAGFRENDTVELAYTNTRWNETSVEGNWFERGSADHRLMLTYEGRF